MFPLLELISSYSVVSLILLKDLLLYLLQLVQALRYENIKEDDINDPVVNEESLLTNPTENQQHDNKGMLMK